jgi:hypothetical protein
MLNMKRLANPFYAEDGGASGAAPPAAGTAPPAGKEGQSDGSQNAGIKSEAQQLADGIVRKRLKGVEKEDVEDYKANKDAFDAWKASEAERKAREEAAEQNADPVAALAAELAGLKAQIEATAAKAARDEAQAAAVKAAHAAGIDAQRVDDAVILASRRVSEDKTLDEAMKEIVAGNPSWLAGTNLPGSGANPPRGEKAGFETRLAEARRKNDMVEAIKIKQEAMRQGIPLL